MATPPPQQKLRSCSPRNVTIEAFHAEAKPLQNPPRRGSSQRNVVAAPTRGSASGVTMRASQRRGGRPSESSEDEYFKFIADLFDGRAQVVHLASAILRRAGTDDMNGALGGGGETLENVVCGVFSARDDQKKFVLRIIEIGERGEILFEALSKSLTGQMTATRGV